MLQTVKRGTESAAQSRSKQEVTSQKHVQYTTRFGLTRTFQPEPSSRPESSSQQERKPGAPKGPTITWSKVKCFALGLAVAHQWKMRKNGTPVADWHAILEVINDLYLQEFPEFRKIYPHGLPNANKLRSGYSDKDRGRSQSSWLMKPEDCTPQETREMNRIAQLLVMTERRLSTVPGSIVRNPAPNDVMWVSYDVNPAKASKERKRKAKDESESESGESDQEDGDEDDRDEEEHDNSEEPADNNDNDEQDDSEEQTGGDENDDGQRSNNENPGGHESSSRSDDPTADDDAIAGDSQSIPIDVDADDDVIVVAIRPPQIVVEDDDDASKASDEVEILNAADAIFSIRQKSRRAGKEKSRRARHDARQTQPQRKKTRLSEIQNEHEGYEEPTPSSYFRDAVDAGTTGNNNQHFHTQSVQLESKAIDSLKSFKDGARPVFKPKADLDLLPPSKRNKPGVLDNAIIQAKAAEAVGNQGGLHIAHFNQKELLRRHKQSDVNAVRHDGEMSFKGLAPPEYPAIAKIHYHTLDPLLTFFDDDYTGNSYSECRRYLITAFQACHGFSVWDMLNRKRGFSFWEWEVFTDLINPITNTTGVSRDYVTRVVFHAKTGQPSSSVRFGKLLAMPTKIDGSKGEPNGTLDKIVQQIKQEPKLGMIHTNDVDYNTEPPTYTIRKRRHGFGNRFRSVHSSESLYAQTGEVRRVLLKDETTGQGKEVDLMLCDKPVCQICQPSDPTDEELTTSFEHAEQRKQLPLVHHKDIVMFEDGALYFVPMEQALALEGAVIEKQDIHDVFFNGGKASKVIFCDKDLCGACKGKKLVADLVFRGPR